MKTLTTLTAVAALIAGLSIASAQSPMSQDKASSMSKHLDAGDRHRQVLHHQRFRRRVELQVCEPGGLRKDAKHEFADLFAESEPGHDRLEAITRR